MPEANQYFLVVNGKPEGPFTVLQLKERNLKSGDFVKTAEMPDYKEAHEIPQLRQLFGFQKENLLQYFASFDQRATAYFIDLFLVALVCVVPTFIISIFISNTQIWFLLTFGLLVIIPLVNFIYHVLMESSAKQGTFAMQLLKIKVCDMNGERLTLQHGITRNFAKLVSILTVFIGYLLCFFNKQQQCLHDMIAGTLVVKSRLF